MEVTVRKIERQHAGRQLAALSNDIFEELDIKRGDYIRINGRNDKDVIVRAWPAGKVYSESIVKIDGKIRNRAGVNIGDSVDIEVADVSKAREVKLAVPDSIGNIKHIARELRDRPIREGRVFKYKTGLTKSRSFPVKILSTKPSDGFVVITKRTEVKRASDMSDVSEDEIEEDGLGVTYKDIGGLDEELSKVREMIEIPMRHPELFKRLGVEPPRGVLLHGPPGTGKTMMAKAVANEVDAHFISVSGPEIMSKYYGESEEKLRETFEEAEENSPSIIFFDEIDAISPDRGEATGDVERRVVAQLLSLMDGLDDLGDVIVIGATNRADSIDNALRRGGRFDREIEIGVPDKKGRKEILQVHTRDMPLDDGVELDRYASNTHGFVGADIESLTKEAAMTALRRVRPQVNLNEKDINDDILHSIQVVDDDFRTALKDIEPSALREVFVEIPDVTWSSVGGLEDTKERLRESIQWPLDYPEMFDELDMEAPKGVMLYGPPGTGKTLLAKAMANESQSNFISVKGPELLNKYVGESEKGVREIFSKARENAPTVVFFDEIDSIAGERGNNVGDSGVGERVVSQLLTELDGLEELEDVVIIATTNRPDLIDSALLRPGRLDRHIHVPVPEQTARRRIFEVHTENKPLADDVDLDELASRTDGYVGADIEALCREASIIAGRKLVSETDGNISEGLESVKLSMDEFEEALDEVRPSVDDTAREQYERLENKFQKARPEDDEDESRRDAFH